MLHNEERRDRHMLYLTGAAMEQMETPSFGFSISLF
jgi:hypothetical protein